MQDLTSEFQKINNLKWYPWVGAKYFDLRPEERILVMGESHYSQDDPDKIEYWDTNKEQTLRIAIAAALSCLGIY